MTGMDTCRKLRVWCEKKRNCYRNFPDSAQSMEHNIILEGYFAGWTKIWQKVYVPHWWLDISVYAKIRAEFCEKNSHVEKQVCANQAFKSLIFSLEKLKGKGNRPKIICVGVIKMSSEMKAI